MRRPRTGAQRGPSGWRRAGAAAALLACALVVAGAAPRSLEDEAREIAAQLRCPVCQNLSVADSPSELANQMRGVIRDKLQAGESREQIEAYFVEKYGEWVLLAPMKRGFNLVAWVLPFVGVVAGAFVVMVVVRRWTGGGGGVEVAPAEAGPPPDPEDARYRERLRHELDEFAR